MGSPPLRLLAVVTALALAAVGTAAVARADEAGARATATAFLDALLRDDAKGACSLFSADAVSRMGGAERCERAYAPSPDEADYEVMFTLQRAFRVAEKSAVKRRGQFVTKRFRATALAREMEKLDEELTVRLGDGPAAARGQLATTVVVDRRSTSRRLVLYAESDDGSIFRISGVMLGNTDFQEVAQGTPEATRPDTSRTWFELGRTTAQADGTVWVDGTWFYESSEGGEQYPFLLVLVPAANGYRIDDLYYSTIPEVEIG
jgi:hypothetical protein